MPHVRRTDEGASRILQAHQCHFAPLGDTRHRVLLVDTFTWVIPVPDFLRNDQFNSKRLPEVKKREGTRGKKKERERVHVSYPVVSMAAEWCSNPSMPRS